MVTTANKEIVEIAQRYLTLLRKHNITFESALLFGSAASATMNEDSDIDIAIIMKEASERFFRELELMKLRRSIDLRIEPHILTPEELASPLFSEIQQTGITIS